MRSGMITLREIENNSMIVSVVHTDGASKFTEPVRYNPGEGLMGAILDEGSTIVIEKVSEEPRFLGRMGLYDPELPFIGSPIYIEEGDTIGVLPNRITTCFWANAPGLWRYCQPDCAKRQMLRLVERKQRHLLSERDRSNRR
jgi:Nif-specific regulatory protein